MNDSTASGLAAVGLILLVVFVALFALWIWGIVDAARRTEADFVAAGSSKTLWIVLNVLFAPLTTIIYAAAVRPKLPKRSS